MKLNRSIITQPFCCSAVLAVLAAATPLSQAAAGEAFNMRYDVEIAGTRIMDISYRLDLDKTGYKSAVSANTRGILDLFSSMDLAMQGNGRINGDNPVPVAFQMGKSKKGRNVEVNVTWTPGNVPETRRSRPLPDKRESAIAKSLTTGMPDPLTALLREGVLAGPSPCNGTERVYNGAEIYDLQFTVDKPDTFGVKDGGVYRGPAVKCLVTYRPVAGLSDTKMQKLLRKPPKFDIWFAPVATRTMGTVYIPVAAAGTLKGHVFTALTTTATLAGAPLNARSLARQ